MYDVAGTEASARAAAQLPKPVGCHMLVMLPEVEEQTKGGIFVPQETKDKEATATVIGYVVAQGADCYIEKRLFPLGPWCKKDDWVLFRPYAGTRVVVHGKEFRLIKDNEICAVVENPVGVIRSQRA